MGGIIKQDSQPCVAVAGWRRAGGEAIFSPGFVAHFSLFRQPIGAHRDRLRAEMI